MKKGQFIKVDLIARTAEGVIFDTTKKAEAEKADILDPKLTYEPLTICLGEGHVLPGLEKHLLAVEKGQHTFIIPAEEGFGKKNAKLLKLIPMNEFKKQNVKPFPGLQLDIDNQRGIVRSVSGGRVIVDFNHPLAGKDLQYDVEILGEETDTQKQIEALLKLPGIPYDKIEKTDKGYAIHTPIEIPKEFAEPYQKDIERLCKTTVHFKAKKGLNTSEISKNQEDKVV